MYKCILALACWGVASCLAFPGGYLAKGGVVDFKRPLDYMHMAKHAGKMAWEHKFEQESEIEGLGLHDPRGARQAVHTPVFYTSSQGLTPPAPAPQPVFGYFRSA